MIRLKGLRKAFGSRVLFSDLDLELPDSGMFSVSGPSGCGKTTLLRILAGLDRSFEGSAEVSGTVSFVFQEDRLIPSMTALENVALVCGNSERAKVLLGRLGLVGGPESGGEKSETDWNKVPSEMSGGMNRRTAVARALAYPHDVLLLDEPFSGLDPAAKAETVRLIREEEAGKLVLLVSHDPAESDALGCVPLSLFAPSGSPDSV
ncbi:MAG: ABC transporter ATP-binding protein [Clostridia bacterium]|nr:ABC transporter ATP-binding protein [Clostridia bacterium]